MKLIDFFRDKCLLLLLHLVCMCIVTGFLSVTGYGKGNIILILIFWTMLLIIWFFAAYLQRRKHFYQMEQILEKVDHRYLLGELLPDSFRLEDRLYREMIRKSNKSVIERIRQMEDEQKDYREYIESWVHEIKAPITSISLLCENRRHSLSTEDSKGIMEDFYTIILENQKIENYVDMALYYARSENVYKDYLIQETSLDEVVCEVLNRNRLLLIQNHVNADVDCKDKVYTDQKWIAFILNQMIQNSVKYQREKPVFHIYTKIGRAHV